MLPPHQNFNTHSLVDNNLALHTSMAETADMAALERILAGRLRQQFDGRRLSLFALPAILRRSKTGPGLPLGSGPSGKAATLKPWSWSTAAILSRTLVKPVFASDPLRQTGWTCLWELELVKQRSILDRLCIDADNSQHK
jgi:hypothetical protein